jgi:hypothetical protein
VLTGGAEVMEPHLHWPGARYGVVVTQLVTQSFR